MANNRLLLPVRRVVFRRRVAPPGEPGRIIQAVFSGIDPYDTRKAQYFPINKELFLCLHEFLQKHNVPNGAARFPYFYQIQWTCGFDRGSPRNGRAQEKPALKLFVP